MPSGLSNRRVDSFSGLVNIPNNGLLRKIAPPSPTEIRGIPVKHRDDESTTTVLRAGPIASNAQLHGGAEAKA